MSNQQPESIEIQKYGNFNFSESAECLLAPRLITIIRPAEIFLSKLRTINIQIY